VAGDRFVLLGLARPRAEWFRSVGQWATSAALPAEFLKCVSIEELRARLESGRAHSAVLLDGTMPAVDRDVIQAARSAGCAVLVVDDGHARRDWKSLGAAAVLPPVLTREVLLDVLATHATMVGRPVLETYDTALADPSMSVGMITAVCGTGGTGASTIAAALAQGLVSKAMHGDVLLADLALNGEQAMLHDVRDVAPGVQELVEAHRARRCSPDEVRALTFDVVGRGYRLLLGLRRARYWSTIRPRSFEVALDSLSAAFGVTVCDVTGDVEGEDDAGSVDVEERNHMARTSLLRADAVFAVTRPGAKGLHSLVRLLSDLAGLGVAGDRIVPVFNQAPRHPRARAELVSALVDLLGPVRGECAMASPIFLPTRKVDEALRDAVPLPAPLPALLAGAFDSVVARVGPVGYVEPREPELVAPGSLGAWLDLDELG
jgi:hypothetical protein